MAIKFGTDGIRGIAYEELTQDVAYRVGNALARLVGGCRVAIGRDTRVSGEDISQALINGLVSAGGNALDCKLMPTAGVSYITKIQMRFRRCNQRFSQSSRIQRNQSIRFSWLKGKRGNGKFNRKTYFARAD